MEKIHDPNIVVKEAMLKIFEDNEAVIKMIIKGRSPTMRHVSRTHRVALDWLFDRINLDPKIQIKYIDTRNQLTDLLTKGNFTRDEWNHLLCLSNISHFSWRGRWGPQGRKHELTSCRGTVQSAWQKLPVRRKGGRAVLPKKCKWPPRGTGTTVLTYPGCAPR